MLFRHLTEQRFSLNNINYQNYNKKSMLREFDI